MAGRFILIGFGLLICFALMAMAAGESANTVTLELPAGDPQAGREAFLALGCTKCHRVAGESGFPEPTSESPGPTLGAYQGRQAPARLAMSIFDPSHEITATVRGPHEEGRSPMPDFTRTMTVRQFLDLVAYIRSLAGRGREKAG